MREEGTLRAETLTLRTARAAKTVPPSSVLPSGRETVSVFPMAQKKRVVVYARNGRAEGEGREGGEGGDETMKILQRRGMQTLRTDSYRLNREENAVIVNVDKGADRILVRTPAETVVTVFPVAAARH